MPIMDGIQCAVKIRQMEAVNGWSPLPIIALTGTVTLYFIVRIRANVFILQF